MHKKMAFKLGSVAPLALAAVLGTPVWADRLDDNLLVGTTGDGLIFVDPEEGVVAPGVKAVTFTSARVPGSNPPEDGPLREVIITDYTLLDEDDELSVDSRSDAPNCLMAKQPWHLLRFASGIGQTHQDTADRA